MNKLLLTIIITAIVVAGIVLSFIDLTQKSSEKSVIDNRNIVESEQFNQESKRVEQLKEKGDIISVSVDESEMAKNTLISFFDYLSKNEFEKALTLLNLDEGEWEGLSIFSLPEERSNKAKVLETYCQAVGTCLRAEVLDVKKEMSDEYSLVVQFLNKDGSIYVFGPCCGATEETMPSKKEFDYKVKKIDDIFKVETAPLYRP